MNFNVDTIPKLSDEDLQQLVAELMKTIKAARRKVFKLLKKNDKLMSTWLGNLSSIGTQKDLPEETKKVTEEKREKFELALISNPEAFIAYQTMAFTIRMLNEVRAERMKRLDARKAKKGKKEVNRMNGSDTYNLEDVKIHSVATMSQAQIPLPSTVCTPSDSLSYSSTCDA